MRNPRWNRASPIPGRGTERVILWRPSGRAPGFHTALVCWVFHASSGTATPSTKSWVRATCLDGLTANRTERSASWAEVRTAFSERPSTVTSTWVKDRMALTP
jgi:hypothetical protein